MNIIDKKGKYTIEVDTKKCIVYEKPIGYFRAEDMDRLFNEYKEYIVPVFRNAFRNKKWVKIVDLREYKLSMVFDKLGRNLRWWDKHGLVKEALILNKNNHEIKVIEVQSKLITKDLNLEVQFFYDLDEGYKWLEENGF